MFVSGSAEAQEALQKFTSFLEAEAEQGHISRSLEKKVLGMRPSCVFLIQIPTDDCNTL